MNRCPGCCELLSGCRGTSSLYGSHDVSDLCESCWLDEEDLIEEVGTNAPEYSEAIAQRLALYRSNMR